MTIHLLTPPVDSVAAVNSILRAPPRAALSALKRVAPAAVIATSNLAHPVYVLGLDALTAGHGVDDAKLKSWRYLLGAPTPEVAAEVAVNGQTHVFSSLNEGPFVADTAKRFADAQADPALAAGDYELRVLRIPALYVMLIWLKDRQGAADVFIPFGAQHSPLVPGTRYSRQEVETLLKGPAAERLAFDDRPKP